MFKNMSIGQKLSAGFAVLALLVVGLAWFSITQLSHLYADTATISGNLLPSTRYASQMHVAILDARRSELAQVIGGLNQDPQEVSERTGPSTRPRRSSTPLRKNMVHCRLARTKRNRPTSSCWPPVPSISPYMKS